MSAPEARIEVLERAIVLTIGKYTATFPRCHCDREPCPAGRDCPPMVGGTQTARREHQALGLCHGPTWREWHVEQVEVFATAVRATYRRPPIGTAVVLRRLAGSHTPGWPSDVPRTERNVEHYRAAS